MTQERVVKPVSGSVGLIATILLTVTGIFFLVQAAQSPAPAGFIVMAAPYGRVGTVLSPKRRNRPCTSVRRWRLSLP